MFGVIKIDLSNLEKSSLGADLKLVQIDTELNIEDRLESFVSQIKNPYRYKVGDVTVNLTYSSEGNSLYEYARQYFMNNISNNGIIMPDGYIEKGVNE